jgi:hypothetical protein
MGGPAYYGLDPDVEFWPAGGGAGAAGAAGPAPGAGVPAGGGLSWIQ